MSLCLTADYGMPYGGWFFCLRIGRQQGDDRELQHKARRGKDCCSVS